MIKVDFYRPFFTIYGGMIFILILYVVAIYQNKEEYKLEINLYSTNCPKCKILEKKLEQKGIEFNVFTDIDKMLSFGMSSAPNLQVEEKVMNFKVGDKV